MTPDVYSAIPDAELTDIMTDESARQTIVVAAENVVGVARVNAHLCRVDPMSGVYLPADSKHVMTGF